MLSFPAAYELFPRYPRSCRLGDQGAHEFLNIYDASLWDARDWLPKDYRNGESRSAAFRAYLGRAERLIDLMARPVPGVSEIKIAGDNQNTRLYLYVSRTDQSWRGWHFSSARGDGTVPLWSAANSPDGNLAGSLPSFVEHATIFRDEWVKVVLRNELVVTAPPPVNAREPEIIARSGAPLRLELFDAQLEPSIVEPGSSTRLRVTTRFPAGTVVNRGDVLGLTARIAGTDAPPIPLLETTDDAELAEKTLSFAADLRAPAEEEVFRIDIDLPPLGQRAVYLIAQWG